MSNDPVTRDDALALAAAAEAIRKELQGRFVTRRAFTTAIALIVAVLIGFAYLAVTNRALFNELEDQTAELVEQTEDLDQQTDILTECTSPDPRPADGDPHECFERGRERTQQIQDEAIEAIVAAIRDAAEQPTEAG